MNEMFLVMNGWIVNLLLLLEVLFCVVFFEDFGKYIYMFGIKICLGLMVIFLK